MSHPMLPGASHDEMAEQLFVRDLKGFVAGAAEEGQRAAAAALDPGEGHNARAEEIFDRLHGLASFRNWAALRRESQELLWDVVGASVRRQAAELDGRKSVVEGKRVSGRVDLGGRGEVEKKKINT